MEGVPAPSASGRSLLSRGQEREAVEVPLKLEPVGVTFVVAEQEVHQHLSCSCDLTKAGERSPEAGVSQSQIHQFQGAFNRTPGNPRVATLPLHRPAEFAADVAELFGERELMPTAARKVGVEHFLSL